MKIVQILSYLSHGDAVGNDVFAIDDALKANGYDADIYADSFADNAKDSGKPLCDMPELSSDDIIIYHLAVASRINELLKTYKAKKIVVYHNITPPQFYAEYNMDYYRACQIGLEETKNLAGIPDYCLADSNFNKTDLINMGFSCKIDVLPILIPFEDYAKEPDQELIKLYQDDGYTNILFTGRVAPNKKFEDVIAAFNEYQKHFNEKARLIFVGNWAGMEIYHKRLLDYIEKLDVRNVVFTGHIPFNQILAYYRIADVFLCMSEHEGFCVPLAEAMYFDIPIVYYDYCATGETMGNGGFVIRQKNPLETAAVIDRIIADKALKEKIILNQREKLKDFDHDVIADKLMHYLEDFISTNK